MRSHEQIEKSIETLLAAGNTAEAATVVLREYGGEILGHLMGRLPNEDDAREVFAMFTEDLWRAIAHVTIRTSMRAYAYALARNAASRYLVRHVRRARRGVPIGEAGPSDAFVAVARTVTPTYLRTETKTAFQELRAELSEEDRAILALRLDRQLEWREIAEALSDGETTDLTRESARLRKRFESIRRQLGRLARERGLL